MRRALLWGGAIWLAERLLAFALARWDVVARVLSPTVDESTLLAVLAFMALMGLRLLALFFVPAWWLYVAWAPRRQG